MAFSVAATVLLSRMWWTFLLRGALAIIFGVIALLFPEIALITLQALIAAWLIVDGVAIAWAGWASRPHRGWWIAVLEGVASLVVGVLIVAWPVFAVITTLALLYLVAFWAIMTGIFEVWTAIRLREQIKGEWFLALAGVISVLFGLYLVIFPGAGLLSLLWLFGIYAILFGLSMVALGWRLRSIHQEAQRVGGMAGSRP